MHTALRGLLFAGLVAAMTVSLQHYVERAIRLTEEALDARPEQGQSSYRDDRNQRKHECVLNECLSSF
jgi:hypothetical protein